MNNSSSRIVTVGFAMLLGVIAGEANAGVVTINFWNGNSYNGDSTTFWSTNRIRQFSDPYDFSVPPASSGNGSTKGISLGYSLDGHGIIFSSYSLYQTGLLIASGVVDKSGSYLGFTGKGRGNFTLGSKGSISSSLCSCDENISVIPASEHKAHGVILAGLGLVYLSIRRRIIT